MNHNEQCKEINHNTDERVFELEKRFDRHLEIYANNGKELKGLQERVASMEEKVDTIHTIGESMIQQISGVGSDVKSMQRTLNENIIRVDALNVDKERRDDWVVWFIRTVFGVIIVAILIVIGVKIK